MTIRDAYEQTDFFNKLEEDRQPPEKNWTGMKSFLTHKTIGENSTDAVIKDLKNREAMGLKKYGCFVHETVDDTLVHLYEELLDAAIYIKTEINRRK